MRTIVAKPVSVMFGKKSLDHVARPLRHVRHTRRVMHTSLGVKHSRIKLSSGDDKQAIIVLLFDNLAAPQPSVHGHCW